MPVIIVHMSEPGIEPAANERYMHVYGPFEEEGPDVYDIALHLEKTRGGRTAVRTLRDPRVLDGPVNAS